MGLGGMRMDTCPPWSFWEVRGRLVIRVSSLLALVLLKFFYLIMLKLNVNI